MRPLLLPSILGLALLAAACASSAPPQRFRGHGEGMRRHGPMGAGMGPRLSLFVSPAGKPFRGAPGQPAPIEAWFAEADANHDGTIGFAEFQADFHNWFAALDTNHDGEIAPDEVTRYETEILPEIVLRTVARYGLIPVQHPIMAADDDFNRGVSVAEFDHAAASRFNLLDERHVGRLTLEQLEARRTLMLDARFEEPANHPTPQAPPEGGE